MSKHRDGGDDDKDDSAYPSWMKEWDQAQGYSGTETGRISQQQSFFSSAGSASQNYVRCHETHKEIALGGGFIVGASCTSPRKGYPIYIGLDRSMDKQVHQNPWGDAEKSPIIEGCYHINDRGVPKDLKDFHAMIKWITAKLAEGQKIHIGCFGGHGRTGLVLSALVAHINGEKDAVTWVRKHHCKKAVESESQILFLVKHFKVKKVKGRDLIDYPRGMQQEVKGSSKVLSLPAPGTQHKTSNGDTIYKHVRTKAAIW